MTHEQKPESAEFRTREAQISSHFDPEMKFHFLADFTEEGLRKELIEAEARGAAEQRRKDAASDPGDVMRALMDSQYVAGAKFGWNCGQDDDHASLHKMIEGRLRDRIEAGVSFSDRRKEKASEVHEREQRRKNAEEVEPVGYVRPDMMEFFRQSKALFTSASIIPKGDETHTDPLYTRPANGAALEDRVKELEGEVERRIAKAVAAERIQIANAFEEFVKYLARDWGRFLSGDGPVIMESIATRVEREAAAIREGGEHG